MLDLRMQTKCEAMEKEKHLRGCSGSVLIPLSDSNS